MSEAADPFPFSRGKRRATLDRYHAQSDISLERHVRRAQLELAHTISDRTKIYLDTNFWVSLRKAESGLGSDGWRQLLRALRDAVGSGLIVCPLSEGTVFELFKQTDLCTRKQTAALMDELSLGITLIEPQMRMGTEISHFIHDKSGRGPLDDLDELVWCKVVYAFGRVHPTADWIDPVSMLAIQKGVFDESWEASLSQIVESLGSQQMPSSMDFHALAAKLNAGTEAHAHELRSFAQAYRAEVRGIVDLTGQLVPEIIHSIGQNEGAIPADAPFVADPDSTNRSKNLLAIALEKDKARTALRSLHIHASLHASHRWNKGRKFDANDLLDFAHAAAALGYCDAFFTEGPLKVMVEQRHIDLVSLFGRTVCASVGDALTYLKKLTPEVSLPDGSFELAD